MTAFEIKKEDLIDDYILLVDAAPESVVQVCMAVQLASNGSLPAQSLFVTPVDTVAAAQAMVAQQQPALVVAALRLPDAQGLAVIEQLRRIIPDPPLVILSRMEDAGLETAALEMGAQDFLVLELASVAGIARAIRHAAVHGRFARRLHLLESALLASASCVVITDAKALIEWANPAFTALTGYCVDEALGHDPHELVWSGKNSPQLYAQMWQTIRSGNSWHGELINRRKDGSFCDEEMTITPVKDSLGNIRHYIAFKQDVSTRKQSERRLAESEERLELATNGASLGLWDWQVSSGEVKINARWAEMLGYQPDEIGSHISDWERLLHPDDKVQAKTLLEQHLRGESEWYECEYRLAHLDEHWVWIYDRGRVVERDDEGKPLRVAGIHLDITARKMAEAALYEREMRLETLLASLPDAVLQIDTSGSLLYCHLPAGVWFMQEDQLCMGRPYARQLPEAVGLALDEALGNILIDGRVRTCEVVLAVAGEERCYQMTVSQLVDSGRFPSGFLAVFRDQTERRRSEAAIRDLAYFDPLTNLPNRRLLLDRLRQAIAVCDRRGIFGGLLFIDLDRFKELNDSLGHEIGDHYLIEVAGRLRSCLRAGDTVARLGGDEFILMLPGLSHLRSEAFILVAAVCGKILPLLERPFVLAGHEYCGSASVGAVLFHGGNEIPEELLRRADHAMYQAKAAGRRAWRWAEEDEG